MLQRQRLVSLLINKNLQNKKHIIVCPKIFTGTKTDLLRRFVHVIWEMLIDFFSSFGSHSEHLTQFFKRYHPRLLQYKILVTKTSHFLAELKSYKLEGAFEGRNLENFEWTLFETWGIYKYHVIKQNFKSRISWDRV